MTGPTTFRFLGMERALVGINDWNHPHWAKLWLYNAHYFDDLMADYASDRNDWHRALIARWIVENPPAAGNGWEPYPTSLRIVNWVKWSLAGNELSTDAIHSLAVQTRHLCRRLEYHLLGNHLLANAKALIFAGTFFEGPEAIYWRTTGLSLLARELDEQILVDGGHFERSPMYHAILLEDMIDLVQLAMLYPAIFEVALISNWRAIVSRMLQWLRVMSHPDGDIAFFNDASFGVAQNFSTLQAYARNFGIDTAIEALQPIEVLPQSGYVRLQAGEAVLIADVGEIGPDYLPGHAHADTLSFELSLHGRRVLVNGGTSTYEANELRLCQRGTAMHNTVQVNGQDSSEVWGSFRVARRARPLAIHWQQLGRSLLLQAAHDGYRRLPGRVVHHRCWELDEQGLRVSDRLDGSFTTAHARFRIAPGLSVEEGKISIPGLGPVLSWASAGTFSGRVVGGNWYPRFGSGEPCQVIEVTFIDLALQTRFSWTH